MKKGKITVSITLAIVCFLLTSIIFMQFKMTNELQQTDVDSLEESELKVALADWKEKYEDAKTKYDEASELLKSYKDGSIDTNATKLNLEKELEELELVLGNTNVEGEGISIIMSEMTEDEKQKANIESDSPIFSEDLIEIVNTLKDAGAEAIEINGERIINTSDISDIDYTNNSVLIKINGKFIRESYYEIKAIGNKTYLESSIAGKGGYANTLKTYGINVQIETSKKIYISAYSGDREIKYMSEEEK